jgi:hypothetical protein
MRSAGRDEWEGGKSGGSHNGIIIGKFRREEWKSELWSLEHPMDDKKGHDFALKHTNNSFL